MARSRNIKPGFFANEYLAELDPYARLLFIGLWTMADREGRLEDRPKKIKGELFRFNPDVDVEKLLEDLHTSTEKFITRYQVAGCRYIQITNWHRHQNPHINEKPSIIPAYDPNQDEYHTSTIQAPEQHSFNPSDSLFSDSLNLIPDSLNTEAAPTTNTTPTDSFADIPQAVKDAVNNAWGPSFLTPNLLQKIGQQIARGISPEWISDAIVETANYGHRSWAYAAKILDNWNTEGRRYKRKRKCTLSDPDHRYAYYDARLEDCGCDACMALLEKRKKRKEREEPDGG